MAGMMGIVLGAALGFTVIALDRPGCGASATEEVTHAEQVGRATSWSSTACATLRYSPQRRALAE